MGENLLSQYSGRARNLPQTLTLDHVSPATRLLEKRRQMFEVQEALDAQKEEFARREDAFRRREEALRKKDLELQESLIKFNKFLQENESKRNRAVKRTQDERKQREQKEAEIVRLKEEHRKRLDEEKALKRELQLNEKYQLYLTNVVEGGSDDYHEIQDLLSRYKSLKDINQDLADAQRKHEQDNEDKRLEFANFKKERQNEMLNQNNDIAKLQKKLEGHERETMGLLNDVDSTIRGTSDKTLELGQILRSVQNLLERFEKQVHSHAKHKQDHPRRAEKATSGGKSAEEIESDGNNAVLSLDEICMYMLDYKDIVDEWLEECAEAKRKERGAAFRAGEDS